MNRKTVNLSFLRSIIWPKLPQIKTHQIQPKTNPQKSPNLPPKSCPNSSFDPNQTQNFSPKSHPRNPKFPNSSAETKSKTKKPKTKSISRKIAEIEGLKTTHYKNPLKKPPHLHRNLKALFGSSKLCNLQCEESEREQTKQYKKKKLKINNHNNNNNNNNIIENK